MSFDSICEYFLYHLPYAIMYGMASNTYWEETDPLNYWAYRQKHILEQDEKLHLINLTTWLSGKYNLIAIASSMSKDVTYPEEPFPIALNEAEAKQREEIEMDKEQKRIQATYDSQLFNLAKKFKYEKEATENEKKELIIERG